jgi:L-threonylcarbamoyladenylate synthase
MKTEIVPANNPGAFGIAADSQNPGAVEKLFIAKDRPPSKAIMLLIGDSQGLDRSAAQISTTARRLAQHFWPGGLTLVVQANLALPANLRADTDTIGVRLPDAPLVRQLAGELGRPLAATSANRSGGTSPRTAQDVLSDLDGRIPLILDGGATPGNLASTVLDCTTEPPRILRVGAIPRQVIEELIGPLQS